MQRIDQSVFGQTVTTLDRWDLMLQYQYGGGRCQVPGLLFAVVGIDLTLVIISVREGKHHDEPVLHRTRR